MKRILVTLGVCIFLSSPAIAADILAGMHKAVMCAACHGANGISSIPLFPNLAGQKSLYLQKQLKDFKSGVRTDPIMSAMAMSLSDADIENVSAYYSTLKR